MERGADIAFLSAFPGEAEALFPPLTYLKPTGRQHVLNFNFDGADRDPNEPRSTCTVVEVTVAFPS